MTILSWRMGNSYPLRLMYSYRLFLITIRYLQVSLAFGIVMCIVMLFYKSFDPMGKEGLEGMIIHNIYGLPEMPEMARPLFEFMFLLFTALSILSFGVLLLVVSYPLQRKEKWAYWAYLLLGIGWPLAGAGVALYTGATAYLYSVAIMGLLFLPPAVILRRYL